MLVAIRASLFHACTTNIDCPVEQGKWKDCATGDCAWEMLNWLLCNVILTQIGCCLFFCVCGMMFVVI